MSNPANNSRPSFSSLGFAKTVVLPGLLVFLVPVIALLFFRHAENHFDALTKDAVLKAIRANVNLTPEQRQKEIAFFQEHPFSELMKNKQFAAQLNSPVALDYATFRWMIRLSVISIACGLAVYLLAGICVVLSLRSHRAQYLMLYLGWQVMKVYGALQTIAQGILLLALSYWVTVLLFEVYYFKIVAVAGLLAIFATLAVIRAIFRKPVMSNRIDGVLLDNAINKRVWERLDALCAKVGTTRPDHIVFGIDDNFYVTEMPVTVGGQTYHGRTLYVSLSLLKQMNGAEVDAVLAHEMAHFSGDDTLYSKKISPLLVRYQMYLQTLYESVITRPIFYFMNCFHALMGLSLNKLSRQREFRADRIAAETTSQRDFATGLLRIVAYSNFRGDIQEEIFGHERVLESVDISRRIETGFHSYAASFISNPEIGKLTSAHPYDSHPPLSQRLEAVGVALESHEMRSRLAAPGDRRWYELIEQAEQIEREQWSDFEERFRVAHEESLPYRFLPATEEELAIVNKVFPVVTIEGNGGSVTVNCAAIHFTRWPASIHFSEIIKIEVDNKNVLHIFTKGGIRKKQVIAMKVFGTRQKETLSVINRYYSRYKNAAQYQDSKQKKAAIAAKA